MTKDDLRLAVLIDGENIPPHHADMIFKKAAVYGEAIARKVYLPPSFCGWTPDILHHHAIDPIVKFPYTKGKNVMDIALVLDAMDFMHKGRNIFDGFCIASSDSDFALLATRIRENGFKVIGFGDNRAVNSFIAACDEFVKLDDNDGKEFTNGDFQLEHESNKSGVAIDDDIKGIYLTILGSYRMLIAKKSGSEWLNLAELGGYLKRVNPEFNVKFYRCTKLKQLLEKTKCFDFHTAEDGVTLFIREKE